ncbi:MAG: MFS transporter [Candidatus Saganbacteria bacterium]|nr:MFS transporter [Candidatus Saganbacteria bacterium]
MNGSFANIFRALKNRNYRLFFAGQSISLIGTWMQAVAVGWLAYRMTNSAFVLGAVAFSSQIPAFIIAPFAGVMVDRWDKQKVLIITQTISLFQALALASLVLSGRIEVWHLYLLGAVLGLVNSIDMPARQSFVVKMVKREDLGNAIALNSSMVNSARLIGPAVAGVLIAMFGEGYCFLINAVSYVAVIISLMMMKITATEEKRVAKPFFREFKDGLSYAYHNEAIRDIILLISMVSLAGMSYAILMPIFAKNILHGGPQTLGFLMSGAGMGALAGGLFLASRKSVVGLNKLMNFGTALFGAGLILFSLSKIYILSLILMPVVGFGMLTQIAGSNTVLQTIVSDNKRGRIMSLYSMAFLGMAPFGSIIAGTLAHNLGAPTAVMINGIMCLIASALFYVRLPHIRKVIRPIYVEKGILEASEITTPPEEC